ncbi:hypothetical protein HPB52_011771 [Rhipicephalus sanguineus]|uniref:Amino acid transporter n=1 Tax=Rhipicephalus sanguineus TaxID=34632 RepID=A0A9D4SX42_RHISA|nr:hypothetical protein HPB52_011771 [Rhipicephalus sanguineus]
MMSLVQVPPLHGTAAREAPTVFLAAEVYNNSEYTEVTERPKCCAWATRHWEPGVIVSSIVIGAILGLSLRGQSLTERQFIYISFPGEVYSRMLAMLLLPLKMSCIVGSIGSTSYRTGGKMLRCALAYWSLSAASAAAVAFGSVLLLRTVRDEIASSLQLSPSAAINVTAIQTTDLAMEMIRGLFPPNIVDVSMNIWPSDDIPRGSELWTYEFHEPCPHRRYEQGTVDSTSPLRRVSGLGLLSFALALGFVLAHNADDRNVLLNFFIHLSNVLAAMGRLLSWFLPLGLVSLTANVILLAAASLRSAHSVSLLLTYSLNVAVAVLVHTFVVLPLVQWLLVLRWNRGMIGFLGQTYVPLVVSASTRSMAASLPLGVSVLEMKSGLDARVVRTVLPMGIVLGRSGSVAQLCVSLLFLTHMYRVDLQGWELIGAAANAIVASLSDDGASPAIVSLLLGVKGFHKEPLVVAAEPLVQWLTTMADAYCNCVVATVCFDIVHEDLSEDDEVAGDEA